MGRKGKKTVPSTPKSKATTTSSSTTTGVQEKDTNNNNDALVASLIDLLESTGIVVASSSSRSSDEDAYGIIRRQNLLVHSLQRVGQLHNLYLAGNNNNNNNNNQNHHRHHGDENDILLRLEQCCFDLRSQLQQYRTYLQQDEHKRVFDAWKQIQSNLVVVGGTKDDEESIQHHHQQRQKWLLQLHSLVQDYKWIFLVPELKRLRDLEIQLDQLYNDDDDETTKSSTTTTTTKSSSSPFETISFPNDNARWYLRDKHKTSAIRILQQLLNEDHAGDEKQVEGDQQHTFTPITPEAAIDENRTVLSIENVTTTTGLPTNRSQQPLESASSSSHILHSEEEEQSCRSLSTMETLVRDIRHKLSMTESSSSITILVTGGTGSGKTHLLKLLQQQQSYATSDNTYPPLLLAADDLLLGSKVGESEARILSVIRHCITTNRILLLDNVDKFMVGKGRMEATFLSCCCGTFDDGVVQQQQQQQQQNNNNNNRMPQLRMVCTSCITNLNETWGYRFQTQNMYELGLPTPLDRKLMLQEAFGTTTTKIDNDDDDPSSRMMEQQQQQQQETSSTTGPTILEEVVTCTEGMTRAELLQACRNNMILIQQQHGTKKQQQQQQQQQLLLQHFKTVLQQRKPPSLQFVTDFCDLTIWTGQDLKKRCQQQLLVGGVDNAIINEGMKHLVIPLCQSRELEQILFAGNHTGGANDDDHHGHVEQQPSPSVGGGGGGMISGILIAGPSGCGKTTLAFHLATRAMELLTTTSLQLIQVSCTSLIHSQVGASEQAIHRLFTTIKQLQKTTTTIPCILLLEDIDTITPLRGYDTTTEGTMDRVVSTVLTELDGVYNDDKNHDESGNNNNNNNKSNFYPLAIIGTTRNLHSIDPAMKRPGRLGKIIEMPRPPSSRSTTLQKGY